MKCNMLGKHNLKMEMYILNGTKGTINDQALSGGTVHSDTLCSKCTSDVNFYFSTGVKLSPVKKP